MLPRDKNNKLYTNVQTVFVSGTCRVGVLVVKMQCNLKKKIQLKPYKTLGSRRIMIRKKYVLSTDYMNKSFSDILLGW